MKTPNLNFNPTVIRRLRQALREDIGKGDITTNLIVPPDFKIKANLMTRETCMISGLILLPFIYRVLDRQVKVILLKQEGEVAKAGETVAKISGPARVVLTGERVGINFVSRLSGIATLTHEFVRRIKPYHVQLLATRKTTPLLRDFEKYAVQCGGGHAHRHGLYDQYLVKDNHKEVLRAMGYRYSRHSAQRMRDKRKKNIPFIIEVDKIREIPWAMSFRPDMILLDNFTLRDLKKAVQFVRELSKEHGVPKPLLEASGGITLVNVREIAKAGVDRISVGEITHSVRSIDFSLEVTVDARR